MIYIGNHVSVSKGYLAMGRHESSLGGNTFAFFPRNPRGGRSKDTSPGDIASLRQYLSDNNFGKLVVHGAYTMNICAAKEEVRANSREMLRDDLLKLQTLPGNFYNFHPGCHVGQGIETAVGQIAEALADLIREVEEASQSPLQNKILLETMAGKGSEVGGSFEQLREIIDRAGDAGYDIQDDLDGVLREFDAVIGLDNLCAVHLNDSKNERGSRKDRHEKLGQGIIGADALRAVVRHPLLQNRPFILETPNDDSGYKSEIETVISWMI